MKIVILAAGIGSRLNGAEDHMPKPLTLLETGHSILEYQLYILTSRFSVDDIYITVGYRKEAIMDRFPSPSYVYNPDFASENTSKSLLRALKKIDDDVLWLNGDILFHPAILDKCICSAHTALVVNRTDTGEEEVKYNVNEQGYVVEISKEITRPVGEALGVNLFKKHDLPLLKRELEKCADTDYFEKGIEGCIKNGLIVRTIHADVNECIEIDFPEDLTRANLLVKSWEMK